MKPDDTSSSSVSIEMRPVKRKVRSKKLSFREEALFAGLAAGRNHDDTEGKTSGKDKALQRDDLETFLGSEGKSKLKQFRLIRRLKNQAKLIQSEHHHRIVNEEHWHRHKQESQQVGNGTFGSRNVGGKPPTNKSMYD